jgi:hypothetical protein
MHALGTSKATKSHHTNKRLKHLFGSHQIFN